MLCFLTVGLLTVSVLFVMFQNNVQRVKVYSLTNDGQWDDQGTGHITIDYIEVWSTLDSYLL